MSQKMIEVQNLSKRFGDNIVLEDVSFDVEKGETVAIIGPSGAGKSMMSKIMTMPIINNNAKKKVPINFFIMYLSRIVILKL